MSALTVPTQTSALPAQLVKGRDTPVVAYKIGPAAAGLPDHPVTTQTRT